MTETTQEQRKTPVQDVCNEAVAHVLQTIVDRGEVSPEQVNRWLDDHDPGGDDLYQQRLAPVADDIEAMVTRHARRVEALGRLAVLYPGPWTSEQAGEFSEYRFVLVHANVGPSGPGDVWVSPIETRREVSDAFTKPGAIAVVDLDGPMPARAVVA